MLLYWIQYLKWPLTVPRSWTIISLPPSLLMSLLVFSYLWPPLPHLVVLFPFILLSPRTRPSYHFQPSQSSILTMLLIPFVYQPSLRVSMLPTYGTEASRVQHMLTAVKGAI